VNTRTVALEAGAELLLVRGFLAEPERTALLAESASYPWEHQAVMGMPTLRANAWFAEDARAVYEYTGQRWVPAPLTPLQTALRDRLEPMLGERMNAVLAGYYPHGGAGVGYHADDEALLGSDPTIASLSIGALRTFQIAHVSRGRPPVADIELPLDDGDLLIMRGTFQRHYRHALKNTTRSVGPRLNLSYRKVHCG
jgi:alkylated DNA repair dioxygenase AlkB